MKTQQTGSSQKPGPFENVLALIVKCPECSTQRAFKVNDSFGETITRLSSGYELTTWCEKCNRQISIQLCWTKRHLGWTVEKITFEKAVTVTDNLGMSPEEGEKII